MLRDIFLLFVILATVTTCKKDNTKKVEKTVLSQWDTIKINTYDNGLDLSDRPHYIFKEGIGFYINYNQIKHSLNYYNIDRRRFCKAIKLFKSGPNKIQSLSTFDLKGDTILFRSAGSLYLIDKEGVVISNLELEDLCPGLEETYSLKGPGGIVITNLKRLYYNNQRNSVVLRTYNTKNNYGNIYEEPLFCEYNLKYNEGKAIKVKYPKDLKKAYYGDLEYPNIITLGDSIIYNFPFMSSIFVNSIMSQKTSKIVFEADHISSKIRGANLAQRNDLRLKNYFYRGNKYHKIDYDPYRDLYYLLYSLRKIGDSPSEKYLIIFDNQFNKLTELKINSEFSPNYAIAIDGLLFRNTKEASHEILILHVLSIDVSLD